MSKRNRKLKRGISLLICVILILGSCVNVFAASYSFSWRQLSSTYNKSYVFTGDDYTTTNSIERMVINGDVAFCLECGRKITEYTGAYEGTSNVDRTKDVRSASSRASKVAYLGWCTSNKSDKAYAFTQMYLWELHPDMQYSGNKTAKFADADTRSAYKTWKADIDAKIDNWATRPSFNGTTLQIKSGESKTITDTKGVLKDYDAFTYTKNGVTIKHTANSNVLTYSCPATTTAKTVIMTDTNIESAGGIKYDDTASANYVYDADGEQLLSTWGAVDPVLLTVSLQVTAPTIGTTAIDNETSEKMSNADGTVSITDTVSYSNCNVGTSYTLTGTLMDKATGNPIKVNGVNVTATKTFSPTTANGSVDVVFKFDGSPLAGKTAVAFESLSTSNVVVATHTDINDGAQTILFPSLSTTAKDSETTDNLAFPDEEVTISDLVQYTNLVVNKEYTLTGTLMNKETGEPFLNEEGEKITATKTFTPTTANGSETLSFTMNASEMAGKDVVVFEDLKMGTIQVGFHTDINDDGQTIHFPEIGTTAKDSDTDERVSYADEEITIIDTIQYKNLNVGRTYVAKGTLMDKATGEPILVNGEKVVAESTFKPTSRDGSVDVTFTFDGTKFENKEVVAFEDVYYNDVLVATHTDINDEDQTVLIPEIGTTAKDSDTEERVSYADEEITIIDTVAYKGLLTDKEYKVTGVLMDKATGEPILVNGEKVVAESTFTPTEKDGSVDVTFTFDGTGLENKTLVAFEEVTIKDKTVATHTDIDDEEQTVHIPEIGTTAVDEDVQDHLSNADDSVTIVDTVAYKNLVVGKEYKAFGTLMDKATGEPILVNGEKVVAESTFTPTTADGSVDVTFTFDGSELGGKTLVAFEEVTIKDKTVATHTDINDEPQTIYIPKIGTTATKVENKIDEIRTDVTIVDTITYENLVVGKEYKISGILMNQSTGTPIKADGKTQESSVTFTPTETSGTIDVSFEVDREKLAGNTTVAFETITLNDKVVAEHIDINDLGQSTYFPGIGYVTASAENFGTFGFYNPETGDSFCITHYFLYLGMASVGLAYMIYRKQKNKKEQTMQ